MIIPRYLGDNGTIGVTAPSFGVVEPLDILRFDNAEKRLSERGIKVKKTPNVHTAFDEEGRSSPYQQRIEEFCGLFEDPEVDVIISASGGDYQFEMLAGMDWDVIERNPKWFQGYSDNTVLAFMMTVMHDIATIYSGNFGDFGMEPWHRSVTEGLEFLQGRRSSQRSFSKYQDGFFDREHGLEPFNEEKDVEWISNVGDVEFSGRLLGGCMDVLDWFNKQNDFDIGPFIDRYSDDGFIWYMETFDMDEARIRKMLKRMRKDGWFENVSGFVFGRPLFYHGSEYSEAICDALKDFDVPKVFGADVGHKPPRMTFINGAYCTFNIEGKGAIIDYDLSRS